MKTPEKEANEIESCAAYYAYRAGCDVSEWEAFLTISEGERLAELAKVGAGTWGREGYVPPPFDKR